MKILILGGGITGLSAAWFCHKKYPHAKMTLLEKSNRLGGWIQTSREEGFLFEKGPRTFLLGKCPYLLALMQELELEIITAPPQKKYLLHQGQLRPLSYFLPQLLPHLLRQPFLKPAQPHETIYAFASRRFSHHIAETLFDPLTLGIYAGDIRKLSMRACFPHFSFKRSKGLFTLKQGMDTLIHELHKRLPIEIIFNCGSNHPPADLTINALPPPVPKKSLWVVNIAFSGHVLTRTGYGYLIPTQEKESLLGMIFDSSIFPEQNKGTTCLTAMVRAEEKEPLLATLSALNRHLGISAPPIYSSAFFAKEAIPQFEVGCTWPFGVSVEAAIQRAQHLANCLKTMSKL